MSRNLIEYFIGILAMIFGFIGMAIKNYAGAICCFGFAFVLWVVITIYEFKGKNKRQ